MSVLEAEGRIAAKAAGAVPLRPRIAAWPMPVAAAALLLLSLALPYWQMTLYAPQYPGGLKVRVYLTGVTGDVAEIDTLNHYIGMRSLQDAASLERRLAVPLVGSAAALLLASAVIRRRRFLLRRSLPRVSLLLRLPALLLPAGVVADLAFWLWLFGHTLDPSAPITVPPFMPAIVGRGTVMQFSTSAFFGPGFFLAVAASGIILYDLLRRRAG